MLDASTPPFSDDTTAMGTLPGRDGWSDALEAEDAQAHSMRASPVYFGTSSQPLLGWWHANAEPAQLAVVVCAPFGLEDLSAYRSLRHLADVLARAGLPTLRFDYAGCGDSAGDNDDGERVSVWLASVHAAVEEARRRSGAARVALVGVRLGALFAATVAAERDDVHALVAIAAPASGRAFVRECRIRMLGVVAGTNKLRNDGGTQAAGFVLNGPTCEALSLLELPKEGRARVPHALVIDRDDMKPTAWAQQLSLLRARVDQRVLPGFAAMIDSAYRAQIPQEIIAKVTAWILTRPGAESIVPPTSLPSERVEQRQGCVQFPVQNGVDICEQVVQISSGVSVVGLLSEPVSLGRRRGVLILNTAGERRIGPSRLWVNFARARAARGDVVLRLDQAGVGDSDSPEGTPQVNPYSADVLMDIGASLAWLREHRGLDEVTVIGLCSGAYHGFHAALACLPIRRVLAINPLLFYWSPGMSIEDAAANPGAQVEHVANAARGVLDPQKWLKLLRGELDLDGLRRALFARTKRLLKSQWRDVARWVGRPLANDLTADLQSIAARGIAMQFVFSNGDPGLTILREETGRAGKRLQRERTIDVREIENADHSFITPEARARLQAQLHDLLDSASADLSAPATVAATAISVKQAGY